MKPGFAIILLLMLSAYSDGKQDRAVKQAQEDGSKVENPFHGVMQDRSSKSADGALFVEKCSMCHRQMGMGTVILARRMEPKLAMLEARDDLTSDYVRTVVRQGVGNMPRIGRGEVSDAQLSRIADYLEKN